VRTQPAVISRLVAFVAGLAAVVAGTFLPWLRSGTVDRSSYSAGDVLRRIEALPTALGFLLDVWPFLSLACAAAAALAVLRVDRGALTVGAICAVTAGTTSAVVLVRGSTGLVRPVSTGPLVTLAGATVVFVTVLISLVRAYFRPRRAERLGRMR
jgi:hypothetical protein